MNRTRRASPATQERNAFAFRRTAKAVRSARATPCFPRQFVSLKSLRSVWLALLGAAFLVEPSSAGEKMISPRGAEDLDPVWSPDGRRMACLTKVTGGRCLCLMNVDGSGRKVLSEPPGDAVRPIWGSQGKWLALEVLSQDGPEIWLVLPHLRRVGKGRHPAFSPDGRWLAWATETSILLIDLEQAVSRTLASGPKSSGFAEPTWSPDSGRVFYASDGSLWQASIAAKSAPRVFLKKARYPYRKLVFSPDARQILIVGDSSVATGEQPGDPLWLAAPSGATPKRIPAGYSPVWLPTGGKIVCTRHREIFVLDTQGEKTHLAAGRAPTVSPDGRSLAFERMVEEGEADDLFGAAKKSKIFVLDLRTSAPFPARSSEEAWSVTLPATVDVGLRPRTDAVARVMLNLPTELAKAERHPEVDADSLRIYEKRGRGWAETPSGIYQDRDAKGLYEVVWRMPGKNEMLTEREYELRFRPARRGAPWLRPPAWRKLAPPSPKLNLVPNPSAERVARGLPTRWLGSAPRDRAQAQVALETANVYHGERCLRLTAADKKVSPQWFSAHFDLRPNRDYLVRFAVRSEIREGLHPIVWLYFFDQAKKRIPGSAYRTGIRQPPKSPEWRTAEQRVRTPSGTAYGQLRVMLYHTLGTGWLDHFSVTPFQRRDDVRVTIGGNGLSR